MFAPDPKRIFHSLMHHINAKSLTDCFQQLNGNKAVGVDKVTKAEYGTNLTENLNDLINRMKTMSYRPGLIREVLIPKDGKPGATRPLGISNVEDKLVQMRMREILEGIYEPLFSENSYGFRPGKSCHDAIRALHQHLYTYDVDTVIDVDISNYFGTIDRAKLIDLLKLKIKDTCFLRYLQRMFKAGVLSEGDIRMTVEGVVQGSCCSPVLANIYAHYVIDEWLEAIRQKIGIYKIRMFRYADDIVICCQNAEIAIWIKEQLIQRCAAFNLTLNADKTKLVPFSRLKQLRGIQQGTFDFLGFTFYLGKTRKGGVTPKVKTIGKRFRAKLKKVNEWARTNRNSAPILDIWDAFCRRVSGHIQYYAVSTNYKTVHTFTYYCIQILFKWLNRRSQKKSFDWKKFELFMSEHPPPKVRIVHNLYQTRNQYYQGVFMSPLH